MHSAQVLYNFPSAPEEAIGAGARVTASRASVDAGGTCESALHPETPNACILIVEDDAQNAKLCRVLLASAGYEAKIAASAEQALEMLPEIQPQLIVADLVLPSMGGLKLAELVRSDPTTRHVMLVAVTSYYHAYTESMAREAGYREYFRKPFDGEKFVEGIRSQLAPASQDGRR